MRDSDRCPRDMRLAWAAFAFGLFLILIVFLANMGWADALLGLANQLPGADGTGHFLLMGTMALLLNLALRARRFPAFGIRWLLGSCVLAALVTMEECSQLMMSHRTFSLGDLACDYAGIALFGAMAARLVGRGDSG